MTGIREGKPWKKYIDLTLCVTPEIAVDAQSYEKKAFTGHLGIHFDVMNREFPPEYTERKGIVFDVSGIRGREIEVTDIDWNWVDSHMFVAFYSGYLEENYYGTQDCFRNHPQLSMALVQVLLEQNVSIIGVDFAGLLKGKEHKLLHNSGFCAKQHMMNKSRLQV